MVGVLQGLLLEPGPRFRPDEEASEATLNVIVLLHDLRQVLRDVEDPARLGQGGLQPAGAGPGEEVVDVDHIGF